VKLSKRKLRVDI